MGVIASQITSLTIVFSTVYLDTNQIKHQSSASLAFVRGIHRMPENSPHKWPVTRKMFSFDDVIMIYTKPTNITEIHLQRNTSSASYHLENHDDVIKWKHFPRYWPFVPGGNSPVIGEFPAQRPVTRSFNIFFDLRLNKRLSKQWWGWWFETPSRPLWRHCNILPTIR